MRKQKLIKSLIILLLSKQSREPDSFHGPQYVCLWCKILYKYAVFKWIGFYQLTLLSYGSFYVEPSDVAAVYSALLPPPPPLTAAC
jgi:hypothetical protein